MKGPAYRVDGRSSERDNFYALACDPARSVVVEACAGSGKTWMLVSRILRALTDGAQPQDILAITFTRKAAGEMRERLNDWLRDFATGNCSDEERVEALIARGCDLEQARQAAPVLAGLHERLLRGGRSVEILTFHAWFSQLLRAAPLDLLAELRLEPGVEVLEDMAEHRRGVLQRFRSRVLDDPGLRADFDALVLSRGRSQAEKWLDAAWDKRIEFELADQAGVLEGSVPDAADAAPEFAGLPHPSMRLFDSRVHAVLSAVAAALAQQKAAVPQKRGELLQLALAMTDSRDALAAAREALLTKGELRKRLDVPGLMEAVELLNLLQRASEQQHAHEEHMRMVRLGRVLLAELADYKRLHGLADMADLERCALAMLGDSRLSGWVQERLDVRIRHVLIDEFQDTSPLQWHALHAWLSSYAGAGGGASGHRPPGVFIVGDPKQSIYRFRRAEPRVFAAARDFVTEGLQGHVLECDHTRRNAPEVLALLNPLFEAAQADGEFGGFRAHTTEAASSPSAGVWTLPKTLRPDKGDKAAGAPAAWRDSLCEPRHEPEEVLRLQEARQVAAAIQWLTQHDGLAPGDIQVLSRRRTSLRLVGSALSERQIPWAATEKQALTEFPEARDLLALLDVLTSPSQDLSLAHALRSPVFGASDDDLVALADAVRGVRSEGPPAVATGDRRSWWAALMSLSVPSPALGRAQRLLAHWQHLEAQLPPHDLLDCIVHQGEVHERVAATAPAQRRAAALGAVDALLGLALTLEGGRSATPYRFVRALKQRAVEVAAPPQPDAVQLLTIHGAKGLEARVVFLMDADSEVRNPDTATLLIDWPAERPCPVRCAFLYSESAARCPASLAGLLQVEVEARQREELNSLYVAITRARERLFVSATEPHRPSSSVSWWQRIEPVASRWQLPDEGASPGAVPPETAVDVLTLPRVAVPPPPSPQRTPGSGRTETATDSTRLGTAVHRVLEWASQRAPVAGDEQEARLRRLCEAAAQESGANPVDVERIAGRILKSPDCSRFFDLTHLQWAGNEVSVSDAGDTLRLDRLVALHETDQRVWWVLDYKLEHHPEALAAYRDQLLRYRKAVQRLQPGEPVRCAFITGAGAVIEVD